MMKLTVFKINRILLLFSAVLTLVACEKEELPIDPVDRGEVKTLQVEMGNTYGTQLWVDLESGSVVASQSRTSWDIAFEGSGENGFVFLNGAKFVKAALSDKSWEETKSTSGLQFNIDRSNGRTDSLAIGDWQKHRKIIVIDRGFDDNSALLGAVKMELISLENGVYTFRYAKLNGTEERTATVPVDSRYNMLMYSFTTHALVTNQPQKDQYDLFFSQYSTILYETGSTVPVDYLVNGVLLNPANVSGLYVKEYTFEQLTREIVESLTLSTDLDVIGYNWKAYNFDSGTYVVDPVKTYVVKNRKGFFYKLHFIDFYNTKGEKGAPKMEYQRL